MGWNAGGFGQMKFPDDAALDAWRASHYTHAGWNDWDSWFENGTAEPVVVTDQLATFQALHKPTQYMYVAIAEQGTTIDFTFETGEDQYREYAADLAALLRSAATHGATGAFHFLGTAGAELQFVYELVLANGTSRFTALEGPAIAQIYDGEGYQAFMNRVMEGLGLIESGEEIETAPAFTITEPEAKTPAAKPAKKPAPKPAAKKPAAKKPAAKPAKKPAAKKPAAKKPAAKKPVKKKAKAR